MAAAMKKCFLVALVVLGVCSPQQRGVSRRPSLQSGARPVTNPASSFTHRARLGPERQSVRGGLGQPSHTGTVEQRRLRSPVGLVWPRPVVDHRADPPCRGPQRPPVCGRVDHQLASDADRAPVFRRAVVTSPAGAPMRSSRDPGSFNSPFGVAVSPDGHVYVTDTGSNGIQVFTGEGAYVTEWTVKGGDVALDASSNVYVATGGGVRKYTSSGAELAHWGTSGTEPGQFNAPLGIAVDASGNVYVADTRNCRVQVFTGTGAFMTQWGALGRSAGQFDTPQGIAVDAAGRVYVADSYNNRIQVFGPVPTPAKSATWGRIKALYR